MRGVFGNIKRSNNRIYAVFLHDASSIFLRVHALQLKKEYVVRKDLLLPYIETSISLFLLAVRGDDTKFDCSLHFVFVF